MEVLSLTVFLSLILAAIFVVAFIRTATKPDAGCVEREALLPLQEDAPPAAVPGPCWTKDLSHEQRADSND